MKKYTKEQILIAAEIGEVSMIDARHIVSLLDEAIIFERERKLHKVLLGAVTSDEITSLDSRIKSCMVENPDEENSEYYAKIWFAYKMNNGNPQPDGRQEFVTETKEQLISEIQDFMKSDKVGWCIL